ncbi:MAG: DUF1559 domain-containing protein, partial [Planctomycetales bacterium]|nr:DUF1559 domain-containing protein [Planctomycetales bacterium]
MPFHFTCPYCFKKTLVDESLVGHAGPCVNCGKTVTIPAPPRQRAGDSSSSLPRRPAVRVAAGGASRKHLARLLRGLGLILGIALSSGLVLYLLWPAAQTLQARRDRVASLNNLQRIAEALNAYALQHGAYPPPVVYDKQGKPLYSWRVLILEQLGEHALQAQFALDQPWDSPDNLNLITSCPEVYLSPLMGELSGLSESSYALVTGKNTLFPKSGPLRPEDISDGPRNTLLVVETDNSTMAWTQPWDLEVSTLQRQIGSGGPRSIGGRHPGGAAVVFADGQP